jgi:hypothetical protein
MQAFAPPNGQIATLSGRIAWNREANRAGVACNFGMMGIGFRVML